MCQFTTAYTDSTAPFAYLEDGRKLFSGTLMVKNRGGDMSIIGSRITLTIKGTPVGTIENAIHMDATDCGYLCLVSYKCAAVFSTDTICFLFEYIYAQDNFGSPPISINLNYNQ